MAFSGLSRRSSTVLLLGAIVFLSSLVLISGSFLRSSSVSHRTRMSLLRPSPELTTRQYFPVSASIGSLASDLAFGAQPFSAGVQTTAKPINYTTSFDVMTPVARPKGVKPCTVVLFTNEAFGNTFNSPPTVGAFAPPAASCGKTWSTVVVTFSARVTGQQFDRIVSLRVGQVEILRSTTPESIPGSGVKWSVERDVTAYSALFKSNRKVELSIGNIIDANLTGVFFASVSLDFYPGVPSATPADLILPISPASKAFFGLSGSAPLGSALFSSIPRNVYSAKAEVFLSQHAQDEFLYMNVANEFYLALPPEVRNSTVPGGVFREVQLLIDGKAASAIFPYPIFFTGALTPPLWFPVSGIGAFLCPTYLLELTPFVGQLVDGKPHTFTLKLANGQIRSNWAATAALHLWLDPKRTQTAGALISRQVVPSVQVLESVNPLPLLDAVIFTTAQRNDVVSGYVVSSFGNQTVTVNTSSSLTNQNKQLGLLTIVEVQQLVESQSVVTVLNSKNNKLLSRKQLASSFPLTLTFTAVLFGDGNFSTYLDVDHSFVQSSSYTAGRTSSSEALNARQVGFGAIYVVGDQSAAASNLDTSLSHSSTSGGCYARSVTSAGGIVVADKTSSKC